MTTISIIGSGNMATVIGTRAAKHGHTIEVMSRDTAKAQALADQIGNGATAGTFGATPLGDIVVVAVPYTNAVEVVAHYGDALAGKVIIDITNTFNADATGLVTPDGISGAQEIAKAAPASAHVVKAFQHRLRPRPGPGPPAGRAHRRRRRARQGERVGVHREPRAAPAGHGRPGDGALAGGSGPVADGPGPPRRRVQHRPRRQRLWLSARAPPLPAPHHSQGAAACASSPGGRSGQAGVDEDAGGGAGVVGRAGIIEGRGQNGDALWSPLAGGLLTGKYRNSDAGRLTELKRLVHTEDDDRKTGTVDAVLAVAADLGVSPAQVAMAGLSERNARSATALVPVIGPRNLAQLEAYLDALDVHLDDEQYQRLDEASRIQLGQPHDLINFRRGPLLGGDAGAFESPVVPVA
jgi:NADP oxidoreductase coenzyme F420-dependent/Aldo/keto reductase family